MLSKRHLKRFHSLQSRAKLLWLTRHGAALTGRHPQQGKFSLKLSFFIDSDDQIGGKIISRLGYIILTHKPAIPAILL